MRKIELLKLALENLPEGILEGFEAIEKAGLVKLSKIEDCNYPSEMIEALFHDYGINDGSNHYWYEIKIMLQNKESDIIEAASHLFDFNDFELKMIMEEVKHYKRSLKKGK